MIRLSIIVPFYNVENYIEQCIRSLYNQDIPQEEYEVICVDDCSPDGSRAIVERLQKEYPTLKLLTHEVNKKLGAARNTGRRFAKGKYIWNVDSDDYICPNCVKSILERCEAFNLDVLEIQCMDQNENRVGNSLLIDDNIVRKGQEYVERFYKHQIGILCPIWSKVYRRDFLDENQIFSPPINMGEDESFALNVFAIAKRVMYIDQQSYIYRINENSLTQSLNRMTGTRLYEATFVCTYYDYKVLKIKSQCLSALVKKEYQALIQYNLSYWHAIFNKMSCAEQQCFRRLCRNNVLKNFVLLQFMTRKTIRLYFSLLFGNL